nr:hypothetical protein [Tanacetum cinerariifolium]
MSRGRVAFNIRIVWPTVVEEDGITMTKKYEEFSVVEKLQADCDLKAINIVLQVNQGDDPIACLNKEMAFVRVVAYSRQCTQPKRPKNASWYKEKAMLAEAQESGQILDEEQLAFLTDPSIPDGKAAHPTIPNTAALKLRILMLMILTVMMSLMQMRTREKMIYSQMDDMIKEMLALKQQIDSLKQNLSNQIKEKESLLQTFTVFKSESKEKEYMDKEIDLEKKIKELDNMVYKVGQSAQTVHMLTKP